MSFQSSHALPSANIPKEADRYAPWVEATNDALDMLRTIIVDGMWKPSRLDIIMQCNDPNKVPISHGSDKSFRKPDVIFITEEEVIKAHNIDKTAVEWSGRLPCMSSVRNDLLLNLYNGGNSKPPLNSNGIRVIITAYW